MDGSSGRDDGGDSKALVARWFHRAYNEGDPDVADEVFAEDFTLHGVPDGRRIGPDGPRRNVGAFRAAFPDIRATIDDQVAEGELVVTRWTATGTHLGPFLGVAPTGRRVTVPVIVVWRVLDGRAVEDWTRWDRLDLLHQLGAAPL